MQKFRPLITLILVLLTAGSLVNVYGDDHEVHIMARQQACEDCEPRPLSISKTPLAITMTFQTIGTFTSTVRCQKAFIFLGDYTCELTDETIPGT